MYLLLSLSVPPAQISQKFPTTGTQLEGTDRHLHFFGKHVPASQEVHSPVLLRICPVLLTAHF